jgi:hypothetical protein
MYHRRLWGVLSSIPVKKVKFFKKHKGREPLKIKALISFIVLGLVCTLSYHFIAIAAIDAPHNESNNVNCGSCHGQGLLNSPFWGGDMTIDQLCLNCHTASSGPYTDISSPLVKTHSSENTSEQYGNWSRECRNCHDPHYQKQKNYKNTDASELYLASGTITSYVVNSGDGTSTLSYDTITYKPGWDSSTLTKKTTDYRRAILFPNVKKLGFSYPVIAIDTPTANTITVKGNVTPVYQYISSSDFAVIYGQFVKDSISIGLPGDVSVMDLNTGDGADGPITINSVQNINTDTIAGGRSYADGVNWEITNSVASGQTIISSGIARPDGFAVGDEIIIINLKGTPTDYSGVGQYEFKTIEALPDSNNVTVDSNLSKSYDGTTQKIMVQRVPHYTDVSINTGSSLTCDAFNGDKGGVLVFRANGTITVNTADGITASNKGFRGGIGINGGGPGGETYNGVGGTGGSGWDGDGTTNQGGGGGAASYSYNGSGSGSGGLGSTGGGGGGGGSRFQGSGGSIGGNGGGGGYGGVGSGYQPGSGTTGGNGGVGPGGGGGGYGNSNLYSRVFLGSGGGAGGSGGVAFVGSGKGGNGGNGGGIVYIAATNITVNNGCSIHSQGNNGLNGVFNGGRGGNGGGGAGGSVAILASQINNFGTISATGGSGPGGAGGGGRTYAAYYYNPGFISFNGNDPAPNYSNNIVVPSDYVASTAQVKFFDNTGTNSFEDGNSTFNDICAICHTSTNHFRNDGSAPDQNHTNVGIDIPGTNCTTCHTHVGGFSEVAGCIVCHATSQGGRAAITAQFSGNSHHIQGVTLTDSHCYQCHWEANVNGGINETYHEGIDPVTGNPVSGAKVDLVIYGAGTRPATYTVGTTAVQYMANGTRAEINKINSHCLGCHSNANNNSLPFGDGKTPRQYAWDSGSIGARYFQTGTTPWGKYSGGNFTPKNTRTKAYSAHGNAINNQGGWDLNETWTNTRDGSENVACFDCHNSHGSSVEGVTASYQFQVGYPMTNGGILKDTIAGKGGYSIPYKPQAGGSTANKNAFNTGAGLCFDCHLTAASGTTLWGYNDTFGATQAVIGYRDTLYFGPGASNPQQRFGYKASNALKGGHLGASSALSSAPMGTINGLCTPCHDPHGVSPTLGSNMQYGVPLLKGTWLTSPYKEDWAPREDVVGTIRADRGREGIHYFIDQNTFGSDINSSVTGITQTDSQFAGLCLNCHPKSSLTDGTTHTWKSKDRIHESVKGWKTANGTIQHNYPCSKCHSPHNTGLPRLMITNCLEARHKGFKANNTAPLIAGEGSGYRIGGTNTNNIECGVQTCADLPGGGDINCSEKLGYCPPKYYTYMCGNGGQYRGGGSGRIPGYWFGGCDPGHDDPVYFDHAVTCHENYDVNQHWNVKTPWASTNPFAPSLIDELDIVGTVPLSVTLEWNSVTSPCYGPIEYSVQVDDDINFGSPVTSSWLSGNSLTVSIPSEGTWYWRVQARDADDTDLVSEWSFSDSFIVSPI